MTTRDTPIDGTDVGALWNLQSKSLSLAGNVLDQIGGPKDLEAADWWLSDSPLEEEKPPRRLWWPFSSMMN